MGNIVAIVGRPNVGKSTLFNRLTESRKAIVDEMSGVTRDRHYGQVIWNACHFELIDTGGYVLNSDDVFEEAIRRQVLIAIEEADVILFVVDVLNGITDLDDTVAALLRRLEKPVFLVANKVDNYELQYQASEFYGLGLGDIHSVSAINGSGTGDLLDKVVASFSTIDQNEQLEEEVPRFAVVGRPNVGKSSLVNALIGEDRTIVTPISGTTRDTIHTRYNKYGHDFYLVDTAGLRKKGKTMEDVEFYSVMRTIRAVEQSDVCLLMIDAARGMEAQDVNIAQLAVRHHKGLIVLVNKWDLIEKDNKTTKAFEAQIKEKLAPFVDLPVLFISALTKQRVHKALELAMQVYENRRRKISTAKLNEYMLEVINAYHPPAIKGKFVRIKYVTQLSSGTPVFAFFCNLPQYIREPYRRYLENKLRKQYNFTGVPLQLFFRKK